MPTLLMTFVLANIQAQQHPLADATWITPGHPENSPHPCPVFKKNVVIRCPLKKATLTLTAHGLYEAAVDGRRVGRALLTPGFTDYDHRVLYQSYDVTTLLAQGRNTLVITVGDGWYRGPFGAVLKRNIYGDMAAIIGRLELVYRNGRRESLVTDTTWQCGTGPIRYSEIYKGECIDHRVQNHGWQRTSAVAFPRGTLQRSTAPPVTAHETFKGKVIGEGLFDFGQNLAGWVKLRVRGDPGDTLVLKFAESLDSHGQLYRGNLRSAEAEDVFICDGKGIETFEPHFTYHGFRYVEVKTRANLIDLTAVALYSDLRPTSRFSCSDPRLNRLMANITWSAKSNFVGIPTDCPQRSERFGWTGDVQVFAPTATYLMNVDAFLGSWLRDLLSDQGSNGAVPVIVPDFRKPQPGTPLKGLAGWGDAATIVPWTLYQVYDDIVTLQAQYPGMKAWVDYIHSESPHDRWISNGYGDWYAQGDSTSLPFIDQCFYYRSTTLTAEAAKVLHKDTDAKTYGSLTQRIRAAFREDFGRLDTKATRTPTTYALALAFDLLPDDQRQRIADCLVKSIKNNNYHLATGFLGTPYLLPVLTRFGYTDVAYALLEQTTCPSWLYPLTQGATTIWEKWDAIRPDGSFDTCSLNHYAYGAVGQWMFETIGGIRPLSPGFRTFQIDPHPGGGLTWAKVDYRTPAGWIRVRWKTGSVLEVTVPPGTRALIGHSLWKGPGVYRLTLPPTAPSQTGGRRVGSSSQKMRPSALRPIFSWTISPPQQVHHKQVYIPLIGDRPPRERRPYHIRKWPELRRDRQHIAF